MEAVTGNVRPIDHSLRIGIEAQLAALASLASEGELAAVFGCALRRSGGVTLFLEGVQVDLLRSLGAATSLQQEIYRHLAATSR